ncbi:MAG: HlyC/CorC family transporter [Bacteroidetes bacterium]|nr:HlyC/CorC family transporter [Bacteroidota bacterium]MBX7045352.1 hemolysin family protein [Ignavibacteria bacterium]
MESFQAGFFDIFLIVLLIIVNALFVAAEFALVRVRSTELDAIIHKGNKQARLSKKIIEDINSYISATQLGITIVNLTLGWIGEDVFTKLLYPVFLFFGIHDPLSHTLAVFLGLLIITFFAVTIGEIAPKTIAIKFPLKITLWFSLPLQIFYRIFKPFIWLLNKSADLSLGIFGIKAASKDEMAHSEEEIRQIIKEGRSTGVIDSTEHQLIEKIFDFNDKTVDEIMVPRNSMFAIDINESRDKIIHKVIEEGFSRIPVYNDTIDNIIGIIYSKDIISAAEHKDIIVLQDILRPAYFVPETKHIGELLKEMQRKHIHLVIVVNEHGGIEGLATLEDIIEEIVGEIEDEYDIENKAIQVGKKGVYLVNPNINIEEFNKKFNADIPENEDEYQTLSGFLQSVTGHIPEIYERIDYKGLSMTVTKKAGNKLLQIKIQKLGVVS